jgi:hypothetical protein
LRSLWGNPWKFESSRPHQLLPFIQVFEPTRRSRPRAFAFVFGDVAR